MRALIIFLCILIGGCSSGTISSYLDKLEKPNFFFGNLHKKEEPKENKSELLSFINSKEENLNAIDSKILKYENELKYIKARKKLLIKMLTSLKEERQKEYQSIKVALGINQSN